MSANVCEVVSVNAWEVGSFVSNTGSNGLND